jgi:major membrane immunogen (membrane-anchored lipoprotein)
MARDDDTIEIKSREGFQKTLGALDEVHGKIPAKLDDARKMFDAVTTAASKNVSTQTDKQIAPDYASMLGALSGAVDNVRIHVAAAADSLNSALTDLRARFDGITNADDAGAADVKNA